MTIDERLDRLVERHEALSQSVELLTKDVRELGQSVGELRQRFGELGKYVGEVAEGTARLLNIAQIHEQRITRWEGGEGKVVHGRAVPAVRVREDGQALALAAVPAKAGASSFAARKFASSAS